ncbi:MAG: class I SAM-dependent methyltransferase [bacterium]|nr:class I SAM-dependent methyltransferase [bacterium]
MTRLRDLLRAYPVLHFRERAHLIVRWRLAPLRQIAALVPHSGLILDLGCGHGLFALLLARQSAARSVIGIDLDAEKIRLAETLKVEQLRFVCGDIAAQTDLPPAQAVTILDVFYLIPFAAQEALLRGAAARLAPGGMIILKEMAEAPRWKVWLNWLEETLAVKVLRITLGGDFYFRPRAEWVRLLESYGLTVRVQPMDRGYYHPHVVFIAHKP